MKKCKCGRKRPGDPSQRTFDATDTTAPAAPGELGVTFAGERLQEVPDEV